MEVTFRKDLAEAYLDSMVRGEPIPCPITHDDLRLLAAVGFSLVCEHRVGEESHKEERLAESPSSIMGSENLAVLSLARLVTLIRAGEYDEQFEPVVIGKPQENEDGLCGFTYFNTKEQTNGEL